jgi:outer membrane protein TolC
MRNMVYQLVLTIFLPTYLLAQVPILPLPMLESKTGKKPYASSKERPVNNYANEQTKAYPIDLATSIRLADANSPLIAIAQARVKAAQARQDLANLLFVPSLYYGPGYFRHDGVDQNRRGDTFIISRSNAYGLGGPSLRVDTAEAVFEPLVRMQQLKATGETARAVRNKTQLYAANNYYELVRVHGKLAINNEILDRINQMIDRAQIADKAGLSKTKGDLNRAMTELFLRKQERIDLEGQAGAAAARLAKVLLLPPETLLVPSEGIYPLVLISQDKTLENLMEMAVMNRPELNASRFVAGAANERLRMAKSQPLIPKLQLDYIGGVFGGGKNGYIGDTYGRQDILLQANWELRNFGFGNLAMIRERKAQLEESLSEVTEVQAVITAEVAESARIAAAKFETLESAQKAVTQVEELYRKLLATSFGLISPREEYDALEPLLAIQEINRARNLYLAEVIDFNRSQFELYMAIGEPPLAALDNAKKTNLQVPALPPKSIIP